MAEYKFIRNNGIIGHIEDIAVSNKKQGQKLGYYIVTALTELGEKVGFYKSILDCDEKNRGGCTTRILCILLTTDSSTFDWHHRGN